MMLLTICDVIIDLERLKPLNVERREIHYRSLVCIISSVMLYRSGVKGTANVSVRAISAIKVCVSYRSIYLSYACRKVSAADVLTDQQM